MAIQCATNEKYFIGAVDCVANKKTCREQKVKGYPTVREFSNGEFSVPGEDLKRGKKLQEQIDERCPKDEPPSIPNPSPTISDPSPVAPPTPKFQDTVEHRVGDSVAAVLYSFEEVIFATRKIIKDAEYNGLLDFVRLLSLAMPLSAFRSAFARLQSSLEKYIHKKEISLDEYTKVWNDWKLGSGTPVVWAVESIYAMKNTKLRPPVSLKSPILPLETSLSQASAKRGSLPMYRTCKGYTCALWRLFHTLSLNCGLASPFPTPQECFFGVHSFVRYFFNCDVCREHFTQMFPRNFSDEFDDSHSKLPEIHKNDIAMWLWKAHNRVNTRLRYSRHKGGGENAILAVTDALYPSKLECPRCRDPDGNQHAVEDGDYSPKALSKGIEGDGWREAVVMVYLHEGYCLRSDADGCASLTEISYRANGFFSTASIARTMLWILLLGLVGVCIRFRRRAAISIRWCDPIIHEILGGKGR